MRSPRHPRPHRAPRPARRGEAVHAEAGVRDLERIAAIRAELDASGLDGLICTLPSNVLMLSGYWPVVGTACALVGPRDSVAIIAPRDEHDFAQAGWADDIFALESGTLDSITPITEALRTPLGDAIDRVQLRGARVGVESGLHFEPFSYVGTYRYGSSLRDLVCEQALHPIPADDLLSRLRSRLTARERDMVGIACGIAERAFIRGASLLAPGVTEAEAASLFRAPLSATGDRNSIRRADGFPF